MAAVTGGLPEQGNAAAGNGSAGMAPGAGSSPGAMAWTSADGTKLNVRHWAATGTPWASVVIVHGIGEHSGRYGRTGRILAEAGLDAWAFDLRGHGLSGGHRVFVSRWDDYLADVEAAVTAVRALGRPVILLGHSMGSLISINYSASGRPQPDLLILSAPPLGVNAPAWQRVVAPVLSRVAPRMVIANPIAGEQLSRDPEVAKAYFADELVQPSSTARLGAELFAAVKRACADAQKIRIPTLVIHGGADNLVPTAASEPLAAVPGVERRVLDNLRHETMNEPEGPEVVASLVAWARARIPGGAA
jgi:alpha-beta hydrolase superfamily lysophospholipase